MNSRQRIQSALSGQNPDRTPVMLHNFLLAVKEARMTHRQYRENPGMIARAHIQAAETYGCDGVVIDIDTVILAGALGVPVDFLDDMPARSHEPSLTLLEQVDDLLTKPDIASYRYMQVALESARLLKKHFGDELYIRGNCDQAAFSLACALRTPAEWLVDLTEEENLPRVRRLLD